MSSAPIARKKRTVRKTGGRRPKTIAEVSGSGEARRAAAVILEVLSGLRGTGEAAEELTTSLTRYYSLEARAVQGLVQALEPLPKGPHKSVTAELAEVKRDKRRLAAEVARLQSLLRVGQRTLGIKSVEPRRKRGKLGDTSHPPKRRRRRTGRGRLAVALLRRDAANGSPSSSTEVPPCPQDAPPTG
jgi:hypothetical protein